MNGSNLAKLATTINFVADLKVVKADCTAIRHLFNVAFKVFLRRCYETKTELEDSVIRYFSSIEIFLIQVIPSTLSKKVSLIPSNRESLSIKQSPTSEKLTSASPEIQNLLTIKEGIRTIQQSTMIDSHQTSWESPDRVNCERIEHQEFINDGNRGIEEIAKRQLVFLVDQTSLYIERLETLKSIYGDSEEFIEAMMSVPIMAVPKPEESSPLQYRSTVKVSLSNEKGCMAGVYGWCFRCRKKADFYCKDFRVPICGVDCKAAVKSLMTDSFDLDQSQPSQEFPSPKDQSSSSDGKNSNKTCLLQYLFELILAEISTPQSTELVIASLIDCIRLILDSAITELEDSIEFIETIKSHIVKVVGSILLLSTTTIASKASNLIIVLFRKYRSYLKGELYSILEDLMLKTLDIPTISEDLYFTIEGLWFSVLNDRKIFADVFVNYDCQRGYTNILERFFIHIGNLTSIVSRLNPQKLEKFENYDPSSGILLLLEKVYRLLLCLGVKQDSLDKDSEHQKQYSHSIK